MQPSFSEHGYRRTEAYNPIHHTLPGQGRKCLALGARPEARPPPAPLARSSELPSEKQRRATARAPGESCPDLPRKPQSRGALQWDPNKPTSQGR